MHPITKVYINFSQIHATEWHNRMFEIKAVKSQCTHKQLNVTDGMQNHVEWNHQIPKENASKNSCGIKIQQPFDY